jgi:hypothetical protein
MGYANPKLQWLNPEGSTNLRARKAAEPATSRRPTRAVQEYETAVLWVNTGLGGRSISRLMCSWPKVNRPSAWIPPDASFCGSLLSTGTAQLKNGTDPALVFSRRRRTHIPNKEQTMIGTQSNSKSVKVFGRGIYFAAADEPISEVVRRDGFDRSLLHNLLFGRQVVVHEAFFFNSTLLREHVESGRGTSLFESAARCGLVSPAFRFDDVQDLDQALTRMHGVYAHADVPKRPDEVHRSILRAVHKGFQFTDPAYPVGGYHLGEGYRRDMEAYFLQSHPPVDTTDAEWSAMGEWRFLIPEAVNRSQGGGLQRAELVGAICRKLGVTSAIPYLGLRELRSLCGSPERERSLELFWTRMNQTHWLNSATGFGLAGNLPAYDTLGGTSPTELRESLELVHTTRLPTIDALLRVDPDEILKVRREQGGTFFDVLSERTPRLPDIQRAFETYASRLCSVASNAQPAMFRYSNNVRTALGTLTSVGTLALALSVAADEQLSDDVEDFVNVAGGSLVMIGFGLGAAEWTRRRPRSRRIEFSLPEPPAGSKASDKPLGEADSDPAT